jgi:transposase
MKQAENGLVSLLFLDASHFVMGCDFLGYVYGKTRRFVKTFSGRKRYNVLGALDFVSKKITTVTNDTYITATEICEMLRKVSQNYVDKTVHIILDNARYQKCAVVQDLAKELGIRLIFIPPYSPNLNLIERLWKFTKSTLRSRYYSQFDIFQETIDLIINSTHTFYKDAINQLIGEKIQLFDDLIAVTENSFRRNPHVQNIREAA